MKFYKVRYTLGQNGEYIYPKNSIGVVGKNAHYHNTDFVIIGETEEELDADGEQMVKLTKKDAATLIKEFQKSIPARSKDSPI